MVSFLFRLDFKQQTQEECPQMPATLFSFTWMKYQSDAESENDFTFIL